MNCPHKVARWRVLVFPGATEIAMELRQALGWCKEIALFSAGSHVSNHAPFVFARHFVTPDVGQGKWVDGLSSVLAANQITHIFPAHDEVLVALAENATRLKAKVITSPLETCRLTRSKTATLQRLLNVIPTPELFQTVEAIKTWPVFLKPDRGQGSQGTALAKDINELTALRAENPDRIMLEYLDGPEFTVDCFSDRERGLQYACGRQRRRIRSGIAMDSAIVDDNRFWEYAEKISRVISLHGAWFFQVKADHCGALKLMEVSPRIGGTSALSRAHGVNLPLLSLYESERLPVQILAGFYGVEIDRALVNRYRHNFNYRALYIDFDDTLIVHGRVNAELVKLLYQALNRGVRLILLTRHTGDLTEGLRRYRLHGLFDEVVHLRLKEPKADSIREKEAVLIDDSFAERMAVRMATGIPVFDTSMIEVLFDERL